MTAKTETDRKLARRFAVEHPREAARLLERLPPDQAADALASCDEAAGSVLEAMDRQAAAACLLRLPEDRRSLFFARLRADLGAPLLRLLARDERESLLAACPEPVARPLRRLLRFAEGTAGALMDPHPLSAPDDITVDEARRRLEGGADDVLCVVDRDDVLVGLLTVGDLLTAPGDALLGSRMTKVVPRIAARAERDAILAHPAWQDHHLLPVVDRNQVLLGVIRYPTMRRLHGELAGRPPSTPLGLALGEMYWTMMSTVVEGVARTFVDRPLAKGGPR
jgi:magnesium transporter